MMTEQDPAIRWHEIVAVVEPLGGCGAAGIETKDAVREEIRIEPVADGIGTDRGGQQPGGADRLAAGQREDAERGGAQQRNQPPAENRKRSHAA